MSSVPLHERSACSLELQRQKSCVHFLLERQDLKENKDQLPIVELQPFTKQVWRREKSISCFDLYTVDDFREDAPPTKNSISPQPRLPPSPSGLIKSPTHEQEIFSFPKFRQKIHPSAEVLSENVHPPRDALIPGFITRDTRTKTTLHDIDRGSSPSKSFSCNQKALSSADVNKQRELTLKGLQMPNNVNLQNLGYLNSVGNYRKITKPVNRQHLWTTPCVIANVPVLVRDQFQHPFPFLQNDSQDFNDCVKRREKKLMSMSPIYRINRTKTSLQRMGEQGPPTSIEQKLNFDLEQQLDRHRKTKNYHVSKSRSDIRSRICLGTPQTGGRQTTGKVKLQARMVRQDNKSAMNKDDIQNGGQDRSYSKQNVASANGDVSEHDSKESIKLPEINYESRIAVTNGNGDSRDQLISDSREASENTRENYADKKESSQSASGYGTMSDVHKESTDADHHDITFMTTREDTRPESQNKPPSRSTIDSLEPLILREHTVVALATQSG